MNNGDKLAIQLWCQVLDFTYSLDDCDNRCVNIYKGQIQILRNVPIDTLMYE